MKNCPKAKCLVSVIAVFIFIFAYDFLVHGVLLADAYKATESLWRPEAQMQSMMWMCFVLHGLLAFLFTALYCMSCKSSSSCDTEQKSCCPIKKGVCFGTILGLLLGALNAAAYIHLPIPASLAISWFFAGLGQGIGVGVVLGFISKSCNKTSCEKK